MIFSHNHFFTRSLKELKWGRKIATVLAASINAVDPAAAINKCVHIENDKLLVSSHVYNLKHYKNIYVIGAGKAGFPMATAISKILGDKLTKGIIIIKDGYAGDQEVSLQNKNVIIEAGHPLPDQRGVAGTKRIIYLLQSTTSDDLVICLLSGGGSSLLTAPSKGIELDHIRELIGLLLRRGATINEINTLRKHLDTIKGGNLVRYAAPASIISLILSDVVGDQLDVIASGPTVPDPSTYDDADKVLKKYQLIECVHPSIVDQINMGLSGELEETPKENDLLFKKVQNIIIGSNNIAAQAAIEQAKFEGFHTLLLTTYLQGEAHSAGEFLATLAKQLRSDSPPVNLPACVICGGETTVLVKGEGLGGRNTELALGAVEPLSGLSDTVLVSLATDGSDGSTDAAGAVVTGDTLLRATSLNLKPSDYLISNDSYNYFQPLGDLLKPGPTQTNVNDLTFIFSL